MSRRDTIIVAILVNAGLLMVLFATATKKDTKSLMLPKTQELAVAEKKVAKVQAPATPIAQVTLDQLLGAHNEEPLLIEPLTEQEIVSAVHEEEEAEYLTITVKQGDVLDKIARANNTTIAQIVAANQLSSTQLQLGQKLKIPTKNGSSNEKEEISPARTPSSEEYYVVKEGDNPWLIASKSRVKLDELLKLNNLNATTAKKLRPGDRLRIR